MRHVFAWVALLCSSAAGAQLPPGPDHGELLRAVHSGKSLWLLEDNGRIGRLEDGATSGETVDVTGRPFDLCRIGGDPVLAASEPGKVVVRRLSGRRWRAIGHVSIEQGEHVLGLACDGPSPVLLTNLRVVILGGASRRLDGELPRGFQYVLRLDGGTLLVGSNAGEWGGSLLRIRLSDGRATNIAGISSPVHDIAPAPGKPGCLVVAIGLVHFFPSGRLTELCGSDARRLFAAPYDGWASKPEKPGDDPYPGIAFFALAPTKGGLDAIGIDGTRRIDASGVGKVRPLPDMIQRGGVHIAQVSPDYWIVMPGINGRGSVGGGMPLVVPL